MNPRKQQAIFPDLPRETDFVMKDDKGNIKVHPLWIWYFQNLTLALQTNFSPEGLLIPPQTAANLAALTNSQGGILLYDSTNNLGKINISGTFRTIVTL